MRTREFRMALTKARKQASACRARAALLQQRLDQTDVSGMQVMTSHFGPMRVFFFVSVGTPCNDVVDISWKR